MVRGLAVLLGVAEYDASAFPPLPIVFNDLQLMENALAQSGYSVRPFGLDPIERTKGKIFAALRWAVREVKQGEVLILYFSGHGLHYHGKDYLIPSEADPSDVDYFEQYLIPLDLADLITTCSAETIVFFVDACRSGVKLAMKDIGLVGWGTGQRIKAIKQELITVLACEPGQEAQYVKGENGYSIFTKALAKALESTEPARTLKEVLQLAQEHLDTLVAEHGKRPQQIRFLVEAGVRSDPLDRIICLGGRGSSQSASLESWTQRFQESPLWKRIDPKDLAQSEPLKGHCASIVEQCQKLFDLGKRALPEDPWFNEDFVKRVLARLEFLVEQSDPAVELTSAEITLVLTAPFVREAIVANGLRLMAATRPLSLMPGAVGDFFAGALDKTCLEQPQLVRKARRLQASGKSSEKDAVVTWLIHRTLWQMPELWLHSPSGFLPEGLLDSLKAREGETEFERDALESRMLLELARCVAADPERLQRQDEQSVLETEFWLGAGTASEQRIRPRLLGYILSLAGWLAIDPTLLSDIIVDHVGLSDPLTASELHRTLNECRWIPVGQARALHVRCRHPAIDLALREHVERIEQALYDIQRAGNDGPLRDLAALPARVSSDGIGPANESSVPAYSLPHVRFSLAQDEIRELLMGTQVYGDPSLALRELYQNALDACRYRQARLAYLNATGSLRQAPPWSGAITLRQGITSEGRAFIECEDNGIGMDQRTIAESFARAGRRFTTTPEYLEEQTEWMKCNPPIRLFPNSQFGIGVLSYFMLSDELILDTCRLNRDGTPGERLLVQIPGSANLFRIQSLGRGEAAGTKVRLYLNKTDYQITNLFGFMTDATRQLSALNTMKRLLIISEFRTTVIENDDEMVWEPGDLRLTEENSISANDPNVWWSNAEGLPLSDGIRIWDESVFSRRLWDRFEVPAIVNFRAEWRPTLTIDRKGLLSWNRKWVESVLEKGYRTLLEWPHLSLDIVWRLYRFKREIGLALVQEMWNANSMVLLPEQFWKRGEKLPIREIGWVPLDQDLLEALDDYRSKSEQEVSSTLEDLEPSWLVSARLAFWACQKPTSQEDLSRLTFALDRASEVVGRLVGNPSFSCISPDDRFVVELEEMSPFQVACIAAHLGISDDDLLKRLMIYREAGLVLPTEAELSRVRLERADLTLLSKDGAPPYKETLDIVDIARLAAKSSESVGSVLSRCRLLVQAGLDLGRITNRLDELISEAGGIAVSEEACKALAIYERTKPLLWIQEDEYAPGRLVATAVEIGKSIRRTYELLSEFRVLGVALPEIEPAEISGINVSQREVELLKAGGIRVRSNWLRRVDSEHVKYLVKLRNKGPGEIVGELRSFEVLGLIVPDGEPETWPDWSVGKSDD